MTNSVQNHSPKKRHDAVSLIIVLFHMGVVFIPLYLAAILPLGLHLIVLSILFGVSMNGLLNLLHECSHEHVFKKRSWSFFLGRWVLGPLVLADFDAYKSRHWDHHRFLGSERDPKYIYRENIRGIRFWALLLRCLFLIEALKKFSVQTPQNSDSSQKTSSKIWIFRTLLVQALLFTSLYLVCSIADYSSWLLALRNAFIAYGVVYLYGVASFTVFISSLRAIAEHQPGEKPAILINRATLRNFSFGFFSGFILGAYGFQHHASHHDDPFIPYYHLKEKTGQLAATDEVFAPTSSYESTLSSLIRSTK